MILSDPLLLPCTNPLAASITPRSLPDPSNPTAQLPYVPQALKRPSCRRQPGLYSCGESSMGVRCFIWGQRDPMAEWQYEAGHLLTVYQRFSHSPSRMSSKPSSPPHSQLSETFPGVVESCIALPELVVASVQGNSPIKRVF